MEQTKKKPDPVGADDYQNKPKESESASNPKHKHYGHRERMRNRFLKSGLEDFQPHEILELLLFYALPQKNTNPIAHDLIHEFHSLSGVLDAHIRDLKQIKGVSDYTAVFLKLIPQICQKYQLDKMQERMVLDSVGKLCDYAKAQLSCDTKERVLLICLDESLQLLHCETISKGTTQSATLNVHQIAECAIRVRSSRVVLAHNHPNMKAKFSNTDFSSTQQIYQALKCLDIQLLDHIVVGKYGDAISLRQTADWS